MTAANASPRLALPPVFDVREIPRPRRHDAIMAVFNQLAHGQYFECTGAR